VMCMYDVRSLPGRMLLQGGFETPRTRFAAMSCERILTTSPRRRSWPICGAAPMRRARRREVEGRTMPASNLHRSGPSEVRRTSGNLRGLRYLPGADAPSHPRPR
jgi:hypothetical protein